MAIITRVDLGARESAVGMFTAGYSMTTIQQLLKEELIIVMKTEEPVLSDKQFTSQLVGVYNLSQFVPLLLFLVCQTARLEGFLSSSSLSPLKDMLDQLQALGEWCPTTCM